MEITERPTFDTTATLDRPQSVVTREFYELLRDYGLAYRSGAELLFRLGAGPPTVVSGVEHFWNAVRNRVSFVEDGKHGTKRPSAAARYEGAVFYYGSREPLPVLNQIVYDPTVYFTREGEARITAPGFDPSTGVFYWHDPQKAPIVPRDGVEHLRRCFSGVPFANVGARNNLFAWLLGAVVLDQACDAPLLVITANCQGVGKSRTMDACSTILTGQAPPYVSPHPEEFEKQLGARFMENTRVIPLDNVISKGAYSNEALSRHLTSGFSKSVRVLGKNRSIGARGVLFLLTANNCRLDPDLTSRSLPVRLFSENPGPMIPYVLDYAIAHRAEIYGELLGLALSAPAPFDGQYEPSFRFRNWLSFVAPRIQAAFGPLALSQITELSDVAIELFSLGHNRLLGLPEISSSQVVEAINASRETYPALAGLLDERPSDAGRRIALGRLLSRHANSNLALDNDLVVRLAMVRPNGQGRPAAYRFLVASSELANAPAQ